MPKETERKFLVMNDTWRTNANPVPCRQAFLLVSRECCVRVRVMGKEACLTVKGSRHGCTRAEYEYVIPREDAEEMMQTMARGHVIEKTRWYVEWENMTWEVDEFHGLNAGLVVAEIEFEDEDMEISLPPWAGREVTSDHHYDNGYLAEHPYGEWGKGDG